jgi:peptide/nickel transport system ATP-binding protein
LNATATPTKPVLELRAVKVHFATPRTLGHRIAEGLKLAAAPPVVRALDGVSIAVAPGEVLGLVGESGCGKSTAARVAAGLQRPTAGAAFVDGAPVKAGDEANRARRARHVQMVFQDPLASLNPRHRVGRVVLDAARHHGLVPAGGEAGFVAEALAAVGLDATLATRWPHELSGGQRQRVGIARALALSPSLVICDEAVAALDVSIQAQVLNLFAELRSARGLAYLFISHDLGVVRWLADRVVVMYLGLVVEEAPAAELFARPLHPYTHALVAETDRIEAGRRRFTPLQGEVPSPAKPPPGCRFHPRCPRAEARCTTEAPPLRAVAPGRAVACHFAG